MLNSVGKLAGLEIAQSLPELWERYPDGLTIRNLQAETGLPYHVVHAAAVWICEAKKAQWVQRPDRKASIMLPMDWEEPAWDLTEKQARVLAAIAAAADETGISNISYRQISLGAGTSAGSVTAHIDALDRKGYLEIIELGTSTTSSSFRAYPKGDGPTGYSNRRLRFAREQVSGSPAA